jgi:hypothetical protein
VGGQLIDGEPADCQGTPSSKLAEGSRRREASGGLSSGQEQERRGKSGQPVSRCDRGSEQRVQEGSERWLLRKDWCDNSSVWKTY